MAEIDTGTTGSAGLDGPAPAPRADLVARVLTEVCSPAVIVLLLPVAGPGPGGGTGTTCATARGG